MLYIVLLSIVLHTCIFYELFDVDADILGYVPCIVLITIVTLLLLQPISDHQSYCALSCLFADSHHEYTGQRKCYQQTMQGHQGQEPADHWIHV